MISQMWEKDNSSNQVGRLEQITATMPSRHNVDWSSIEDQSGSNHRHNYVNKLKLNRLKNAQVLFLNAFVLIKVRPIEKRFFLLKED